jgi:acyl-CoA thioester hydrolase
MEIEIHYEDTDCAGVVYYANYLKYFERARTYYLRDRNIAVTDLIRGGTQFMVTHAEVHYRSPARYGHVLTIETRVTHRSKATLTFSHTIRERASRQIVVEGSATLASVNLEGKLKRLPQPLRDMPEQPLPPLIAPTDSHLQTAPRSLARRRGKQSG